MTDKELLREIKDIRYYHEICTRKCHELEKELEADSSASSKKNEEDDFINSDLCKSILAKRELLIQRKLKN